VHVDDAALAVLMSLEAPLSLVGNEVFNVGCDEQNYTIQQAGETVQRLVPASTLISMGSDTDKRNYKVSFGKIHKTLGFVPRWSVEQGVRQVIEAIESGKVKNYHDAKYSNVKFLSDEGTSRLIRRQNGWAHELIKESSSEVAIAAGE
jgi:dTDP-D-glucose 4,6-dehydratase